MYQVASDVSTARVERLIGVYHATGGIIGELRYAVGKVTGRSHCALCDITHRGVLPRKQWRSLVERLTVPVTLVHLNEQTDEIRAASRGRTPCVLAEVASKLVVLLDSSDLEACNANVEVFEIRLRAAMAEVGGSPG